MDCEKKKEERIQEEFYDGVAGVYLVMWKLVIIRLVLKLILQSLPPSFFLIDTVIQSPLNTPCNVSCPP